MGRNSKWLFFPQQNNLRIEGLMFSRMQLTTIIFEVYKKFGTF